jgi:hypothetical protein
VLALQIEGFKLHVTHNVRPFTSRIRYTPEAASRPERMVKDLANAKKLAAILEDESASLRTWVQEVVPDESKEAKVEDVAMTEHEGDDDPEPKERGSDAVDRRIEKIMSDLCEQGLVDVHDEKAYEAKKVSMILVSILSSCTQRSINFVTDNRLTGFVSGLPSCRVSHMLLLLGCIRSS